MKRGFFYLALLAVVSTFSSCFGDSSKGFVEDADCDLGLNMIFVEGGSFIMGNTPEQGNDNNGYSNPAHSVTLDSFYIGECEITQEQWLKIMGDNPSHFEGPNLPVECISWRDAQKFCAKLSLMSGKKYELPTEAQWEYAARGGKLSQGYKFSGSSIPETVAWTSVNSNKSTQPVKTKTPNELGLYDMSGNVWEFCSDWLSDSYYRNSPEHNPTGAASGSFRVMRGGCWGVLESSCRVSCRWGVKPAYRDSFLGLRVVCVMPQE